MLPLTNYFGLVVIVSHKATVVATDVLIYQVDELKHGGRDTQVTNGNRIEYIHLMADYRLNRQARMCTFSQGSVAAVFRSNYGFTVNSSPG